MKCNHCNTEWNLGAGASLSPSSCPFCGQSLVKEEEPTPPCEKCPVCENPVDDGATKCDNCGFEDERGVNREWVNPEDYNRWLENTVKPCRAVWGAARKREAGKAGSSDGGTSFTDPRDGQVYRTVKIGGLVWMAENLNFKINDSWCYGDDESNGEKYGRLYTWDAAKAACPKGWHLPSREEWDKLIKAVGGGGVAGKKLKSKTVWPYDCNGTDEFGFSALPGGYRSAGGSFFSAGNSGYWWSATESGGGEAYRRYMYYNNDYVFEYTNDVRDGFSARCVEDCSVER